MIDYKIIADSIEHYTQCGYVQIETPWMVSKYIDNITKPSRNRSYQLSINQKCLVASGEQSFLQLYLDGTIPCGKFQTVTPCFRDEPIIDNLHSEYFIKNELINTTNVNQNQLIKTIDDALSFIKKYIPDVEVIKTDVGYDIVWDNIELGSYGIRHSDFLSWIYATGVAEPRLSKVIHIYENKKACQ